MKRVFEFNKSFELHGYIIVGFYIGKNPHWFIVDTGAPNSVLNLAAADKLDNSDGEVVDSTIVTNTVGSCSDTTFDILLNFWGQKQRFHLMDINPVCMNAAKKARLPEISGLIGADFLEKHRAIIDYKTRTVSFSK